MKYFLEKLEENSVKYADKPALGNGGKDIFTYKSVWDISGRVYRYLAENNIGTEAFVMINLPRGAETIIACIGIWRAGAAVVIIEEGYPKERTEYIYTDCSCKMKIDKSLFESILKMDTLEGYKNVDPHDAAYACYTSGSTGTPKGVLHEYGVLDQTIRSFRINQKDFLDDSVIGAIAAPLNFVLIYIIFPCFLYFGGKFLVIPSNIGKDGKLLEKFFFDEKITVFFTGPSLLRVISEFNPEMKLLFVGSERIKNVYYENMMCVDAYAQSETGFYSTYFQIDKPYETTPIGKPSLEELEMRILDEEGNEVLRGEVGEICFNNPYFREYINQKELTEYVKRGGVYHCGDMGRMLEDGNIVLLGRTDDMVKINGNRIEPGEVEKTVRDVLKVEWAYVKCVEHEGRDILVAYFLGEPDVPLAEAREIISLKLPYYMVPSQYIMLDEIPTGPYGKVARSELPEPDFSSTAAYSAPRDDIENKLTRIWENAFGIEKIGIDDDFYELGGDSILSLEVVSALDIRGFTVEDLFRERTIRKNAEYIRKKLIKGEETNLSKSAKKIAEKGCRLSAYQMFFYDRQCYYSISYLSTMLNMPILLQYEGIDVNLLCDAVNNTILSHPLMLTKIYYDEDNNLYQKYDKSLYEPVEIQKITEEEFKTISEELVKPFTLLEHRLFRINIFDTGSKVYLFLDVHHIISDGTSMHVLLEDIYKAYKGEILRKDYIYLYLKREESRKDDDYYKKCEQYLKQAYDNEGWSNIPKRDHESKDYSPAYYSRVIKFDESRLALLGKEFNSNENAIFLLTTLLTLAKYNNNRNVVITWTYHGRDTKLKKNMFGLLIKDLVIALRLDNGMTVKDAMDSVNRQIASGIAHSVYPYSLISDKSYEDDSLCFLYQKDLYDFSKVNGIAAKNIELAKEDLTAENSFSVQMITDNDQHILEIDYLKHCYEEKSVIRFCDIFEENLQCILRGSNEKL